MNDDPIIAKLEAIQQHLRIQALEPTRTYKPHQHHKQNALRTKLRAINMLGNQCNKCKKLYPPACMHFHHIDPTTKTMNIGHSLARVRWSTLEAELKLCILLCANCHAIEHNKTINGSMDAYKLYTCTEK